MSLAFAFDDGLTTRWSAAVDAHKRHAHAEWPREAGGLILEDGSYAPLRNIAGEPLTEFETDPAEVEAVSGHRYLAVLHSHCSVEDPATGKVTPPPDCPSGADMEAQIATAVPWGISLCLSTGCADPFWFGDQVPRPPLLGRQFRHGVNDCYSLGRDWHREVAGILIPDFVRDPDWWQPREGQPQLDLYRDGFERAGFRRVERGPEGPLPGDCFLCRVRSPVLNHGGIYIGGGLILHHLAHQLSGRDPAAVWRSKLDFLVRHTDLPDDWRPPA
ncbi:NlpC/P60 family protein [Methylobacterium nodulans]|uniref:NLP/P60 protein n=1 Tax=Methylobacterium nodulans (strain LMG 21967 / CNCM I-2342 / ORS 2060) TaxID=460265 RepID=B8IRN1_METNO|nr:NlpC/P60 family protein [Methylobacterium nodulans]ACL60581.1 NLP/P60 protein [Methylobacterium nodulans ORS 2060]